MITYTINNYLFESNVIQKRYLSPFYKIGIHLFQIINNMEF